MRVTRTWHLYVLGRRVHHGRVGAILAAIGVALILDDIRDWPWPTVDP